MRPSQKKFEKIVCPITGRGLKLEGSILVEPISGKRYPIVDDIPLMFMNEDGSTIEENESFLKRVDISVADEVQKFYTIAPFPNYNDFDDLSSFVRRAEKGIFAKLLSQQIPINSNVLEVGCGTAQLSNFLAAITPARFVAADMTLASLALGNKFAIKNNIQGIQFLQMNLFKPAIEPESMDLVISNGVLHHTYDTEKAFYSISKLVKPGGYIVIGLYNHIGRLRTDFRRVLVRYFGEKVLFLDPHLRNAMSPEKRRAWINDQYYHPQERKYSMTELISWFDKADFEFVSSIPKIVGQFRANEALFKKQPKGSKFDRLATEIGMLFSTYGGEGGLFICIGRKKL